MKHGTFPKGHQSKPKRKKKKMNEQEVVALMESSKTEAEWNANCDKVRKACGGYPEFWYPAIVSSGMSDRKAREFKVSPGISSTNYGPKDTNG